MILGWWIIKKYIHKGGIFLVLGSTTVLLTVFAARHYYNFFTPISALFIIFLSTAFITLVSVKYKSRSLALLGLILAGIAPMFTKYSLSDDYISIFSYLLVVVIGVIWVTLITGRRELILTSIIMVAFYSLLCINYLRLRLIDPDILLLFAYTFAGIFFITNTISILKLKDREIVTDLITATINGLLLLTWIMGAAPDEWKSLIIVSWMIVFIVGAYMIFKATKRHEPFYVYAGVGVTMLVAATSVELKGASLTIAYIIEGGMIPLTAYLVLNDVRVSLLLSCLMVLLIPLSVKSLSPYLWSKGVPYEDFFVILILGLTLFGIGLFFLKRVRELGENETSSINTALLISGSIYLYALLWLYLKASLNYDNIAVMISLIVYTIIGIICYFSGLKYYKNSLKIYGAVMIFFVVGRLILVDIWSMEMTGRIVTFFLIGALLIATAFLGKKKTNLNLSEKIQ